MPAAGRGAREMGHRLQAHPSAATPGTTGRPARQPFARGGNVKRARRPALTAVSDGTVLHSAATRPEVW